MRILCIGDVVGQPGRRCLKQILPGLKRRLAPDLVVVNGENASGGLGLSAKSAGEIFLYGVDVITTGNHVWRHKDLPALLEQEPHLLRPANYPAGAPGKGVVTVRTKSGLEASVVNLEGRIFMSNLDCPFRMMDGLLKGPLSGKTVILVDFHAEATSEKLALAWHLKGRVSGVVGTHTHVQTADEQILPGGTAYLTDLGMTGPHLSVIGVEPELAVARFMTQRPHQFQVAAKGLKLQGAYLDIDPETGRATGITRLSEELK